MTQSQYATVAQLQTLAVTQAAASQFGEPSMVAALQAASSICDGFLTSQFTLPLQTDPIGWDMSLVWATCAIAAYLLYKQYGFAPQAPGDELIVRNYDDAMKWLKGVSDEVITPNYADSSGDPEGSDEAGPFVDSDLPVGFTTRGIARRGGIVDGGGFFDP